LLGRLRLSTSSVFEISPTGCRNCQQSGYYPDLPPTATKLLKTLLDADEPMGRSEIIEAAGISGSSYDRYINELAAWDIIEPTESEGRRRWEGHLEPWWSPRVIAKNRLENQSQIRRSSTQSLLVTWEVEYCATT